MNKAELIAKNAQLRHAIAFEKAEAARYRAALEDVLEQIGTSGGFPPDLTIKAIENIADRALAGGEEEG